MNDQDYQYWYDKGYDAYPDSLQWGVKDLPNADAVDAYSTGWHDAWGRAFKETERE